MVKKCSQTDYDGLYCIHIFCNYIAKFAMFSALLTTYSIFKPTHLYAETIISRRYKNRPVTHTPPPKKPTSHHPAPTLAFSTLHSSITPPPLNYKPFPLISPAPTHFIPLSRKENGCVEIKAEEEGNWGGGGVGGGGFN